MARLCFGMWDVPGRCDIPTMTRAINAHIRRHDIYHSWFEVDDTENTNAIVRRTIDDPQQIEFIAHNCGEMTAAQLRSHLLDTTVEPLQWGCFTFGIIQRKDHFTVYMSVDHLVTDGMSAGVIFVELHFNYASLLLGTALKLPPPASYLDYCIRQRERTAALTRDSAEVGAWMRFAELNNGTLPGFALPLGDRCVPSRGAMTVVPLMDDEQSENFEAACADAGVRFSGGVFACAALAEHELTGTATYCGLTPYDTRATDAEQLSAGWFASFIPITAPVGNMSFADVARAAQASFDAAKDLAGVPFDRALELSAGSTRIRAPERAVPLLSFIDARKVPVTDQWDALNAGIYGDSRLSDQVCMWVNRFSRETTLTVSYPDNPVARDSIDRYIQAIKSAFASVSNQDHEPVSLA